MYFGLFGYFNWEGLNCSTQFSYHSKQEKINVETVHYILDKESKSSIITKKCFLVTLCLLQFIHHVSNAWGLILTGRRSGAATLIGSSMDEEQVNPVLRISIHVL